MRLSSKVIINISVIALTSATAYTVGSVGVFRMPKTFVYELAQAIPPSRPVIQGSGHCVGANERERTLVRVAVDALAFSGGEGGQLGIGAQKFLSHGMYRTENGKRTRVCDLPEEYERATQAILAHDHFGRGGLVEYQLKLIAKLPNPKKDLATLVAKIAFHNQVQLSERFRNRDLRPFARATLGRLGPLARPYADIAFQQISIDDSMGTGAAQVAVAGEHPMALHKTEDVMSDTLKMLPEDQAVPRETRDRLYEMAYALQLGGSRARQHLAPLHDLLSRKVESWAPPFGMIELPPRRMCGVLASILEVPMTDLEHSHCADTKGAYEQ